MTTLVLTLLAGCGGAAPARKPSSAKSAAPATASSAPSTSGKLTPFAIGYPAIGASFDDLYIGVDKGFFRQYGLAPKLALLRGSSSETGALVSGSVQAILCEANPCLDALARGVKQVMVGNTYDNFNMQLLVKPSITAPKQLEGKTLGLLHVKSLADSAARTVLPKLGVDLSKVKIDYLGAPSTALAGLVAGKVDAMVNTTPETFMAEAKGFKLLVDFNKWPFIASAIWVKPSFLKAHPGEVEDFLKGYIRSVAYIENPANKAAVEADLSKRTKISNKKVLAQTYNYVADNFFEAVPTISKRDLAPSIAYADKAAHAQLQYSKVYDPAPLQALIKSGFVAKYAAKTKS